MARERGGAGQFVGQLNSKNNDLFALQNEYLRRLVDDTNGEFSQQYLLDRSFETTTTGQIKGDVYSNFIVEVAEEQEVKLGGETLSIPTVVNYGLYRQLP